MIHIIVSGENCEVEANTTVDQFGSFSRAFFYESDSFHGRKRAGPKCIPY